MLPLQGSRFDSWSGNKDPKSYVAWPKKKKKGNLEEMSRLGVDVWLTAGTWSRAVDVVRPILTFTDSINT